MAYRVLHYWRAETPGETDVAVKAIEGARGSRALSHINQIAVKQAKNRPQGRSKIPPPTPDRSAQNAPGELQKRLGHVLD